MSRKRISYCEITCDYCDKAKTTAEDAMVHALSGWMDTGSSDYCPNCAKKIKQELQKKEDEK